MNTGIGIQSIHQNTPIAQEYKKAFRLSDKDNVQIYTLPKGKLGKRGGSFIYTPKSGKALHIERQISRIKVEIKSLEYTSDPNDESYKKLNLLRSSLKYHEKQLSSAIASTPKSGYIVLEGEE